MNLASTLARSLPLFTATKVLGLLLAAPLAGQASRFPARPRQVVPSPLQQDIIDPLAITINGASVPVTPVGSLPALPHGPGWFNLSAPVVNQLDPELFVLGLPDAAVAGPGKRPLVVVFHQFNASHGDVISHTDFLAESQARGWYLLGPLSRSPGADPDINFGSAESQEFTRAGLEWVLDNYPIDRKRIFAVGFSMGGAAAASYAARHMDPKAGMFAALVDHTGSVDQVDTYYNVGTSTQAQMQTIFGGTPFQVPFNYRRSSCIELDLFTPYPLDLLPGGTHMAVNLTHVPTQFWWNTNDNLTYLVNQTEAFASLLNSFPGAVVDLNPVNVSSSDPNHSWDTMPALDVCNWLDTQQLTIPTASRIIADHDGRWYHFDLTLDAPGQFARLTYDVDLSQSLVAVESTHGLSRLVTRLADWGPFNGQLPLTVRVEALDAGDELVFQGITTEPQVVYRDGLGVLPGGWWDYDQATEILTLRESQTGLHVWSFLP
jgi:pimeloyl-ACP methyl ester carboxylesterase